jgi:hypothetical protein
MPKIIKVYNGTQRLDDVAVRRPRYSKPQGSCNQSRPIGTQLLADVLPNNLAVNPRNSKPQGSSNRSRPIEPLLNQASDKNDLGLEQFDFNFNDDYGEYNELPIPYFDFESEYDYIFQSINPHIKYMVGDARDSNQILFMQDFEFDQNTNQFTFKSVIVSVALVNVRSLTGSYIVMACSCNSCYTHQDLGICLPAANTDCLGIKPAYIDGQFITCKHSAVAASYLARINSIRFRSLQVLHDHLTEILTKSKYQIIPGFD